MSMQPVFIGGCDRSGTTMLGAMLGSHSECLCVPEAQFIIDILKGGEVDSQQANPAQVLKRIASHPRFGLWAIRIEAGEWFAEDQGVAYADIIEKVVQKYGRKHAKVSARLWVDHTPSNLKHTATLFSIFPEARMIHMMRDGRAVAASLLSVGWGPKAFNDIANLWLRYMAFGLAAEQIFGPQRVMRIKFEDLVGDPETTLRAICDNVNIDYQPNMLEGHGFEMPAFTRASHKLVGKTPDPIRIDAWKRELLPRQVEIFENICGDVLVNMGYTPQYGVKARDMTSRERLIARLNYFRMLVGNYLNQVKLRWYGWLQQ